VIYVSKEQLNQVEYLIEQSIRGNHVLFDLGTVREIFNSETCSTEESYSVEHHIERLMVQSSLEEKRAYLDHLDADTFQKVVKTYFNIVENNLYENVEVRH
jgi:hypothetical protein